MMKLCSIISVWADCECLLDACIKNHLQFCDGVIVVWSSSSNHGVKSDALLHFITTHQYQNVIFHQCEPQLKLKPIANETRKRNRGIDVAREHGFTHFFLSDADEMYIPEEVDRDKKLFDEPEVNGIVVSLVVYVGKPTLWTTDHTLIPFIHKLTKGISAGNYPYYPFAYDKAGHAYIDPSRRLDERHGIIMSRTVCRHYSYVRSNINMKIKNSTAKLSNREAFIKADQQFAAPGYVSKLYGRPLQESPNYFDIAI